MRSAIARATIVGALLAGATVVLIVLAIRGSMRHSCEVCMTFHGRTVCRTAAGATRDEAIRTATDNACGLIASGMTQTVECTTRTAPAEVTCE